ncbi:DUF1345 domain-containing protein [Mycobacteroides abscessus]|uniref:DUF1345 domain-containing protein n=1 Tax=Mycobacteroides abscessus subsp. bolletii 50594 TaxID=1303024 RepID=A0AB33AAX7_9MYCO|nr:DUF1345 domain-containing protein [Mycobacteroides abscessus]AGM29020.1 hypothetical protein MASS_2418 [Mycobacteroides abscessus subsp. bolletii 50594]MBE5472611.1 hypothetical protein [Mycobacteroides abscessus]RIT43147.1 DUF1345 domain-containing protein [Mycobacteroides abscessus]SKS85869.1 Predicted membrane protein [Mycobacteroides abscessus subsp. massiliense]SKT34499.1 Predicted membrane protein [Mycobacteroides abscessus subsp. massiliense]
MTGANRFWIALAVGIIAGALTGSVLARWQVALLAVVIVTAVINVVWSLVVLWPMDPDQTRTRAGSEDMDDELGDLAMLLVLVASLSAIGILLVSANDEDKGTYAGLCIGAILTVWAMLHTIYAARYARIYYQGVPGGIDFNSDVPPRYVDFYYFSFNLGMTYQVSDTAVTTSHLRDVVLKHCLFSYIYGTVIIACTINLVINLVG